MGEALCVPVPSELLSLIFSYLDLNSMKDVCLVSKEWREIFLFSRVHFRIPPPTELNQSYHAILQFQWPRVRSLSFAPNWKPGERCPSTMNGPEIIQVLEAFPNTVSLDLSMCRTFGANTFRTIRNLSHLKHLYLDKCTQLNDSLLKMLGRDKVLYQLETLSLNKLDISDNALRVVLLQHGPTLKTFRLKKCSRTTHHVMDLLKSCPNLTSLDISDQQSHFFADCSSLCNLTKLKRLDLSNSAFKGAHLPHLSPSIQHLVLNGCESIDDLALQILSRTTPKLKSLELQWCDTITDRGLNSLAELHGLESLSLWSCKKITTRGLKKLVAMPSMKFMDLQGCVQIKHAFLEALAQEYPRVNLAYDT